MIKNDDCRMTVMMTNLQIEYVRLYINELFVKFVIFFNKFFTNRGEGETCLKKILGKKYNKSIFILINRSC